jgi:hypothetical protein
MPNLSTVVGLLLEMGIFSVGNGIPEEDVMSCVVNIVGWLLEKDVFTDGDDIPRCDVILGDVISYAVNVVRWLLSMDFVNEDAFPKWDFIIERDVIPEGDVLIGRDVTPEKDVITGLDVTPQGGVITEWDVTLYVVSLGRANSILALIAIFPKFSGQEWVKMTHTSFSAWSMNFLPFSRGIVRKWRSMT